MGYAVSVEMYASGEVSDYTAAVIDGIASLFAQRAGVGTDYVTVTVTAASVRIEVLILAIDEAAAELLTSALSAVTANATAATAFLSSIPGIDIYIEEVIPPQIGPPPRPPDDGSAGRVAAIVVGGLAGVCMLTLLLTRCGSAQEAVTWPHTLGAHASLAQGLHTQRTHARSDRTPPDP